MKKTFSFITAFSIFALFSALAAYGSSSTASHGSGGEDKFGDLIHESTVAGYMLSYYFMDLREQKAGDHAKSADHRSQVDKPHHLMVYIMDNNRTKVVKGKVGFLIKDAAGNKQKAMGMAMSDGFGSTADMKQKGTYTIVTKAVLGEKSLMDTFEHTVN